MGVNLGTNMFLYVIGVGPVFLWLSQFVMIHYYRDYPDSQIVICSYTAPNKDIMVVNPQVPQPQPGSSQSCCRQNIFRILVEAELTRRVVAGSYKGPFQVRRPLIGRCIWDEPLEVL